MLVAKEQIPYLYLGGYTESEFSTVKIVMR